MTETAAATTSPRFSYPTDLSPEELAAAKLARMRERYAARAADGGEAHYALMRRRQLWTLYRLTPEEVEALLEAQGRRCPICGEHEDDLPQPTSGPRRKDGTTRVPTSKFVVDHDHACCPSKRSCGKCVRGLLCHADNQALGLLRDDPQALRRAADYLEKSRQMSDLSATSAAIL